MKKTVKIVSLLLCLTLLLCACGQNSVEDTTAPAETAVTTEAALKTALEQGGRVELGADLALSNEVVIRGQMLDGGGYTLTGPVYNETDATTQNGIAMVSGTVENVIIKGAFRCIGDTKANGVAGDIRINNITVDSEAYALNFGYGSGMTNLYVTGSRLQGWSSYTKFMEAKFTDCTFAWNESGTQGGFRPYINTTLSNCHFEGKTDESGAVVPFAIDFKSGSSNILLILEDCYVGDTLITAENLYDLLSINLEGNTIDIRNTVG